MTEQVAAAGCLNAWQPCHCNQAQLNPTIDSAIASKLPFLLLVHSWKQHNCCSWCTFLFSACFLLGCQPHLHQHQQLRLHSCSCLSCQGPQQGFKLPPLRLVGQQSSHGSSLGHLNLPALHLPSRDACPAPQHHHMKPSESEQAITQPYKSPIE